jgi:hypothetical protein
MLPIPCTTEYQSAERSLFFKNNLEGVEKQKSAFSLKILKLLRDQLNFKYQLLSQFGIHRLDCYIQSGRVGCYLNGTCG